MKDLDTLNIYEMLLFIESRVDAEGIYQYGKT